MSNAVVEDDFLPGRATAAGVTIQLGPMFTMQVDLASQRESDKKDSSFPYACPDHGATVVRCNQVYQCQDEKKPHIHPESELLRARESDDGKLVHATKDEIAEIRTGALEKGVLELRVHPADEVAGTLRNDGLAYRARPPKKGSRKPYAVLKALAERDDIALVGWLRLKDSRRLYRVEVWNGQLMLQSLIDVADMRGCDQIALPELAADEVERIGSVIAAGVEPFEPEEYLFDKAAAVAEFVAARADDPDAVPVPVAAAVSAAEDADIISMLEASLAGAKKKAPKKARAKKATAA